jgi:HEAT repeat protein
MRERNLNPVLGLIHAPQSTLRRAGVEILELLGDKAVPVLPSVAEALGDQNRFVRWAAARAIGNIGPKQAPFAVPGLARLLFDLDDNVRLAASATLEAMGAEAKGAVPALVKAVVTGDAEPRVASMYVLVSIGADHCQPALGGLIESLKDEDPRVRRAAADVLGKLAPIAGPAIPALRKAMEDDDQEVRINAGEAILAILAP